MELGLKRTLLGAAASLALLGIASSASAASVSEPFPSAGTSYFSATDGSGTITAGGQSAYMWTTGDYVTQTFTGTGLNSVTSYSAQFQIQDYLGNGNDELWDILINGTMVGSFEAFNCAYCGSDQTIVFNAGPFAAIVGAGTYDLAFVLVNTVPDGGGSIAFLDGGVSTLAGIAATPLPATWTMLIAGFAGLGFFAYRGSKKNAASLAAA